jgi:ribonuclease G
MSKELVISANRHETRVAIVEDDQVMEVYHQREKEYSLAGSIHKGRVTRVLPGMQSAFVDIGLDRDAFLYVSDFFEDNDEYDKIVTSVEEKVLKLDRSPQTAEPVTAVVVTEPDAVAAPAAEPVPSAESTAAVAPGTGAAAASVPGGAPRGPDQRRDDGDRRGGRRGRRRRGQRGGRGLPESKFYSPGGQGGGEYDAPAAAAEAPVEPVAPPERVEPVAIRQPEFARQPATQPASDMFVLPGESLAKYTRPENGEAETAEVAADETPEVYEGPDEQDELAGASTSSAGAAAAPQRAPEPVEPEVEEPEAEAIAEAMAEAIEEADAAPEQAVTMAAESSVETEVGTEAEVDEIESDGPTEMGAAAEAVPGEVTTEEEGPEPARIPTSLTATLRDQGNRYLHRVSRRMRRKGRGPEQGRGPDQGRGPQQENRSPETGVRTAPEPRVAPAAGNGKPEKSGAPSISDLLKEGQEIIVQIAKEPLGQKGARITSHIALPGRFLVYMPTVDHVGVSRKIPSDDERLRLKRILQTHRAGIPGGFIVRTAGEGHTEEELRADMMFLYNLWMDLRQKAERKPAPALIHHDLNVVERVLRDQLTAAFKSIWVDNEEVYESVLRFVQRFQPALVNRVKMYTRSSPIFDEFGITAELEKALRPKVWLKSGGYIVINQTEALVAIDVNTGKFVGKSNRLEDTIVKTNTDAIKEIVRQIRLRDLGGIIVVDFIDMDERRNRQKVMQALEESMRADRAPYKILQFNDFGLVAITRKRVKQSLERTLCMPCPYCEGAGYVKSAQTVVGEILQEAHKVAKAVEGKDVMLRVSPDVARMLKSNQNSYLQELEEILGRTVLVKSDALLHQEKFDLA